MTRWDEESGLYLFTPEEFTKLPNGFKLTSISKKTAVKGTDYIDQDTRFGHLAFGVVDPWNHPDRDLFLTFILSE